MTQGGMILVERVRAPSVLAKRRVYKKRLHSHCKYRYGAGRYEIRERAREWHVYAEGKPGQ